MIDILNSTGHSWLQFFIIFELQNSLFILIIFGALFFFRNYPAKFRKQLTLIALIKTIIPPFITMPFLFVSTGVAKSVPVFFMKETLTESGAPTGGTFLLVSGFLFLIWLIGMALIITISVFNSMRLHRCLKRIKRIEKPILAVPGNIRVFIDDSVKSPFVYGWLRPKIILPGNWKTLDKQMQRLLLLHEINHVRSGDLWFNSLKILSLTIHFFNPLHWALLHYFELFTEMACDDRTVRESGINGETYNALIVKAAEAITIPMYVSKSFGFSRAFKLLEQRIQYQLKTKEKPNMKRSKVLRLTILAALFLLMLLFSWQCNTQKQEQITVAPVTNQTEKTQEIVDENGVYAFFAVDKKPEMLEKGKPVYPEKARKAGIEGLVGIVATIDENGQVIEAVPLEEVAMRGSNGDITGMKKANHIVELEPAAIEAARNCTFIPAEYNGQAVKVKMAIPFRFRLH